jgi:hypothetical protein
VIKIEHWELSRMRKAMPQVVEDLQRKVDERSSGPAWASDEVAVVTCGPAGSGSRPSPPREPEATGRPAKPDA